MEFWCNQLHKYKKVFLMHQQLLYHCFINRLFFFWRKHVSNNSVSSTKSMCFIVLPLPLSPLSTKSIMGLWVAVNYFPFPTEKRKRAGEKSRETFKELKLHSANPLSLTKLNQSVTLSHPQTTHAHTQEDDPVNLWSPEAVWVLLRGFWGVGGDCGGSVIEGNV